MIPLLCLYIIRKLKAQGLNFSWLSFRRFIKLAAGTGIVLLSSALPYSEVNEFEHHIYKVYRKGKEIGFLQLSRLNSNHEIIYQVKSEIRTRVIINLAILSKEKSVYRGDTLVYSRVLRKINNKIKIDHELEYTNGTYQLSSQKKISKPGSVITQINLAQMFFIEPKDRNRVYSDSHNQLLKLNYEGDGRYQVLMPNGDKHSFRYLNGELAEIVASGLFYRIKIKPE